MENKIKKIYNLYFSDRFFDKNKFFLYLMLIIFCIINVIVYECIK